MSRDSSRCCVRACYKELPLSRRSSTYARSRMPMANNCCPMPIYTGSSNCQTPEREPRMASLTQHPNRNSWTIDNAFEYIAMPAYALHTLPSTEISQSLSRAPTSVYSKLPTRTIIVHRIVCQAFGQRTPSPSEQLSNGAKRIIFANNPSKKALILCRGEKRFVCMFEIP